MRFSRRRNQPTSTHASRVIAWGDQIVKVHRWLRSELNSIQAHVDAGEVPRLQPVVQAQCLSFCDALHSHHTGEDDGAFPQLELEFPQLTETVARLRREHQTVARILTDVRALLESEVEPSRLRERLAELSEQLDAHMDFEEAEIVEALNAY